MGNNHDFGSGKKKHGFLIPFIMFFCHDCNWDKSFARNWNQSTNTCSFLRSQSILEEQGFSGVEKKKGTKVTAVHLKKLSDKIASKWNINFLNSSKNLLNIESWKSISQTCSAVLHTSLFQKFSFSWMAQGELPRTVGWWNFVSIRRWNRICLKKVLATVNVCHKDSWEFLLKFGSSPNK